jgi:hypothetical protein
MFNLYTAPPHTHISFFEGVRMIRGNRNIFDIVRLCKALSGPEVNSYLRAHVDWFGYRSGRVGCNLPYGLAQG